ncbi:MAG TPA: DUF2066 domain-containing protein [Lichenihabitans sp.]|jgi:hypothetical protein|nr:DUF2066 domain-containing protein [Lichenihabitans sp.]
MARLVIALCTIAILSTLARAAAQDHADLYTTHSLVTGQDERNRPLGFRLCFEDVLVKVSGDPGITADSRVEDLAVHAGQYISTYSYRDRFEGKPKHDEQGTYDRPFFMTCAFDPAKIDAVLSGLGRAPWLAPRPALAIVLVVHGRVTSGVLSSDGPFDPDMRESLAAAARRYELVVDLPSAATLRNQGIATEAAAEVPTDRLRAVAAASGADLPLVGELIWSDAAHGWVATWRLATNGGWQRWTVSGVNYDEAFRVAVRGAMSVLSGHGPPRAEP